MERLLYALLLLLFVAGCGPQKEDFTALDYETEKEAIIKVMEDYNKAAEEKNFAAMIETLAGEVIFFGTDSAEVIKTFPDFKEKMNEQWRTFDKMKYGDMYDISIQMDDRVTLASIIFGTPLEITIGEQKANLFIRVARTLKKEKGKWVIVSGIVGNADANQALLLNQMLQAKEGKQIIAP
jgi:ketosteroid isomerase-like protein